MTRAGAIERAKRATYSAGVCARLGLTGSGTKEILALLDLEEQAGLIAGLERAVEILRKEQKRLNKKIGDLLASMAAADAEAFAIKIRAEITRLRKGAKAK